MKHLIKFVGGVLIVLSHTVLTNKSRGHPLIIISIAVCHRKYRTTICVSPLTAVTGFFCVASTPAEVCVPHNRPMTSSWSFFTCRSQHSPLRWWWDNRLKEPNIQQRERQFSQFWLCQKRYKRPTSLAEFAAKARTFDRFICLSASLTHSLISGDWEDWVLWPNSPKVRVQMGRCVCLLFRQVCASVQCLHRGE